MRNSSPTSMLFSSGSQTKSKAWAAIWGVFFILTILYYFLRFQFGLVVVVPVMQVGVLGILAMVGLYSLVAGHFRFRNLIDVAVGLIMLHFVLFMPLTILRDGVGGAIYGVKEYLLPLLMYFSVRGRMSPALATRMLDLIGMIMVLVALIYAAEFVSKHILRDGYFQYTELMEMHAIEKGSDEGLSKSVIEGDIGYLIRMPGPLSHNNTTALAIAFGLVISVLWLMKSITLPKILSLSILSIALLMTGARTATFSAVAGIILVVVMWNGRLINKAILKSIFFFIGISILVIFGVLVFGVFDMSSFIFLFSFDEMLRILGLMFSSKSDYLVWYAEQVQMLPFSPLTGVGYRIPGSATGADVFRPVISEDLFVIQLFSSYGWIIPALLLLAIIRLVLNITRKRRHRSLSSDPDRAFVLIGATGVLIVAIVSTVHTNALIKAQIFPIFIFLLAIASEFSKCRQYLSDSIKPNVTFLMKRD